MSPDDETLADKLKSLGVQVGARHIPTPQPKAPQRRFIHGIEEVLAGSDLLTPFGSTFVTEQHYPNGYAHGRVPLCDPCDLEKLAAWGAATRLADPAIRNVVFLDTETTGLMGGTGTHVFMVGLGYRTGDGFHLAQFFLRDPAQEEALLAGLSQWLTPFNVVVTFNGKNFDLPLLRTRYLLNSISIPFDGWDHLDLLILARRIWRDRLPSRALPELEKAIVQFMRSGEDIPGWLVPQLYFDYLRTGDARPLSGVFYHNAMDILSLAALFNHVAALLTAPDEMLRRLDGGGIDLAAIARLYEDQGDLERAAELYEASLAQGLPAEFFFKAVGRYAAMRRRQGDYAQAARLWQKSAEAGDYDACLELAKYYEHHARDYTAALQWTECAMRLVERVFQFQFKRREALLQLQQRAERVRKKMKT